MIDVDFTRLSSKGQIVIPQDMRKDLCIGDKFIIIRRDKDFVLKPAEGLERNFLEDLDFARKTLEALKRYGKGRFREKEADEFLAELERW